MMCMNGSILPANDCSSIYLSIVGIAPVCMTVFGFVFSFILLSVYWQTMPSDLHMAQLMPMPLIVSCFTKIQIGFTSLVPAHPGSPGQTAIKRMCVCVQPSTAAVNVTLLAFAAAAPCCCAPCCSRAVAAKRPMLSINISVASDRPWTTSSTRAHNKIWRRTESTPRSGWWRSHIAEIYSDCSIREINNE